MQMTINSILYSAYDDAAKGLFNQIDALAAVLTFDGDITTDGDTAAPVRKAILDFNSDGYFNQDDVTIFADSMNLPTADNPIPLLSSLTAYNRFNLNGAGGLFGLTDVTARFDLDPLGLPTGDPSKYGGLSYTIDNTSITLDENSLTDLDILCYYAYSPLYLGDEATLTRLLPASLCRGQQGTIGFIRQSEEPAGSGQYIYRVYTMDSEGGNQSLLSSLPANSAPRDPSPNGRQILVTIERDQGMSGYNDLYVINIDGSSIKSLTKGDPTFEVVSRSAWSPDGSRVAFSAWVINANNDAEMDVFVVNADGSQLINLTDDIIGTDEQYPTWSADGKLIYFKSSDRMRPEDPGYKGSVYIVNADGTGSPYPNPMTVEVPTGWPSENIHPIWSPDGQKVAYRAYNPDTESCCMLYVEDADGSNRLIISVDRTAFFYPNAWSPDGQKLVYRDRDGMVIINADGTFPVRFDANGDKPFGWSADGQFVLFARYIGSNEQNIMKAAVDGSVSQLTSGAFNLEPFWIK